MLLEARPVGEYAEPPGTQELFRVPALLVSVASTDCVKEVDDKGAAKEVRACNGFEANKDLKRDPQHPRVAETSPLKCLQELTTDLMASGMETFGL